jgi:hypothetical protein
MTKFLNSRNPDGVDIDGRNDEAFGNLDDPCNPKYDANDTSQTDQTYRTLYQQFMGCQLLDFDDDPGSDYHLSIDPSDPTFSQPNVLLDWGVTAGPYGTVVDRISSEVTDLTPGGAVQSMSAVPYYRDDSCFDDGTGSDPGPKVHLRSGDEPSVAADGTPRRCWHTADGDPGGSDHFYQGSIGTHGMHLLFLVDSDNARQTVPLTEIVADWRMVMLPGDHADRQTGEEYGRGFEKPLLTVVADKAVNAPTGPPDDGGDGDGGGDGSGGQGGPPPAAGGGNPPGNANPGGQTPRPTSGSSTKPKPKHKPKKKKKSRCSNRKYKRKHKKRCAAHRKHKKHKKHRHKRA